MDEEMDRTWQALSEEVLSGMKEWRLAHPKATFREIEQAVEERVNRLKARMLQDAALASEARDWTLEPEQQRPTCPRCGTTLQARGTHARRLQAIGGQDITLSRSYGTCPTCGVGLFPPR
jgi:RNase P subunit RPR2